jgi:hypothetical protein
LITVFRQIIINLHQCHIEINLGLFNLLLTENVGQIPHQMNGRLQMRKFAIFALAATSLIGAETTAANANHGNFSFHPGPVGPMFHPGPVGSMFHHPVWRPIPHPGPQNLRQGVQRLQQSASQGASQSYLAQQAQQLVQQSGYPTSSQNTLVQQILQLLQQFTSQGGSESNLVQQILQLLQPQQGSN